MDQFDTQLSPEEEQAYQKWALMNNLHPDNATYDYDMKGFWKALNMGDPRAQTAINPDDNKLHFSDAWKKPWHPTFSDQSIYAPKYPYMAGQWQGENFSVQQPLTTPYRKQIAQDSFTGGQ